MHLGFHLQTYETQNTEDQTDKPYNQVYNPHIVLLLQRTGNNSPERHSLAAVPDT
jgi:hypothetical protein